MAERDELPDFDALWDYQAPAETERKFKEILPRARDSGDSNYLGSLLSQIARAQGLQRQFADAHQTLDEVEAIATKQGVLRTVWIRYLLERGRAFNSSGDPGHASTLFLEAWEGATKAGEDFHAVDAAHMLGICAPEAQRLKWNIQALTHAERSAEQRARNWRGSLYNNIGWTLYEMGRFEAALDYFQRALAWRTEQNQPREQMIAKWCVGKGLRALGRVDEALELQRALCAEQLSTEHEDGYVHEEIGECLLTLGQVAQARPHFARASELLSQDAWLAANEPDRLRRLADLGALFQDAPVREHSA